jgi:aminoglycoside 3-N-acetyltransferase
MRQPLSVYVRFCYLTAERFYGKLKRKLAKLLNSEQASAKAPKEVREKVDLAMLKAAFESLRLKSGDTVLVHSGISNLGKVVGGPKLVFDLIQEIVGEDGNVLYPVFPFGGLMYAYLSSKPEFDVKTSPTKMGALTEYALKAPGGERSVHPTHSILAFGKKSQFFVAEHHLCETPFADQSPFARLLEDSGKILLVGVGLNSTTHFHRIEDRLGAKFPVKVYKDDSFTINCTDAVGQQHKVKTVAHDPLVSRIRDCDLVKDAFVAKSVLKEVAVGQGTVGIIDAKAMDDCLEELCLNKKFSIYGKLWG